MSNDFSPIQHILSTSITTSYVLPCMVLCRYAAGRANEVTRGAKCATDQTRDERSPPVHCRLRLESE